MILESLEYPLIAIILRSTLAWSESMSIEKIDA